VATIIDHGRYRQRVAFREMRKGVMTLAVVAVAATAAPAEAAEVRTCRYNGGQITVRTTEEECQWPREIVRAAIREGFPKKLDLGRWRYNRSEYRRGPERIRVRYRNPESRMWHRITIRR
jgi:hypothetical protein